MMKLLFRVRFKHNETLFGKYRDPHVNFLFEKWISKWCHNFKISQYSVPSLCMPENAILHQANFEVSQYATKNIPNDYKTLCRCPKFPGLWRLLFCRGLCSAKDAENAEIRLRCGHQGAMRSHRQTVASSQTQIKTDPSLLNAVWRTGVVHLPWDKTVYLKHTKMCAKPKVYLSFSFYVQQQLLL